MVIEKQILYPLTYANISKSETKNMAREINRTIRTKYKIPNHIHTDIIHSHECAGGLGENDIWNIVQTHRFSSNIPTPTRYWFPSHIAHTNYRNLSALSSHAAVYQFSSQIAQTHHLFTHSSHGSVLILYPNCTNKLSLRRFLPCGADSLRKLREQDPKRCSFSSQIG